MIHPGDGASYVHAKFRMVVFRPFEGEILVGRIERCSRDKGIQVSLGFFDNILIPPEFLQSPSTFDESEHVWVWNWGGHELFMDTNEKIRFRVHHVSFRKQLKPPKEEPPFEDGNTPATSMTTAQQAAQQKRQEQAGLTEDAKGTLVDPTYESDEPMMVLVCPQRARQRFTRDLLCLQGTIALDGLGLKSWWKEAEE